MTNFDNGLILGLTMPWFGSAVEAKEPVAYLYNGVRLPALPDFDRETYLHAYIYGTDPTNYYLVLSVSPAEYIAKTLPMLGSTTAFEYWQTVGPYREYRATTEFWNCKSWTLVEQNEASDATNKFLVGLAAWCNTNLVKDGVVQLTASEPVLMHSGDVINDIEKTFVLTAYPFYREDMEAHPFPFVNHYSATDANYGFTEDFCLANFPVGTNFRITFDGESRIYRNRYNGCWYIGNRYFETFYTQGEDDGFDLLISHGVLEGILGVETNITGREEREYTITIESLITNF